MFPKTLAIIEQGRRDQLHLGAQLYVSRDGEVAADLAVGESRPGVAMRTDSVLLWLSAVKPLIAVAIAQLFERGQLDLDDLVSRFIPGFANRGKEDITVRHLLTHTGGFRSADKIPENLEWAETLAKICQAPLEPGWTPGAAAGYHLSSSWFVLGEIVQRLDGRPLPEYVREEIFEPLGMKDSWLGLPAEDYERYGDRIGFMYVTEGGELRPHPFWNTPEHAALCRPGSNGRGPIHDLGRFYEKVLAARTEQSHSPSAARQILKPETVRLFTSRQRAGLFDKTFQHRMDWGLGFMVNNNRCGIETVPYGFGRHSSEETFGHSGAQSSAAFADPAYRLVVAWVCNGQPGERLHQQRARALNTAIYEDLGLRET